MKAIKGIHFFIALVGCLVRGEEHARWSKKAAEYFRDAFKRSSPEQKRRNLAKDRKVS